jgi:hypothetical protein
MDLYSLKNGSSSQVNKGEPKLRLLLPFWPFGHQIQKKRTTAF